MKSIFDLSFTMRAILVVGALVLTGCANNPIVGLDSGDKGVFFKRLSIGCVVGRTSAIELSDVSLSEEEVHPGDILAHTVAIDRCVKENDHNASGMTIRVIRQIMVGGDAVATSTEDVTGQINRNGIWEVKSQINIGKNPPGRYAIRTTVEAGERKLVRVNAFTVVR